MKIIEYNPKYNQEIFDFVMSIKSGEIGWTSIPEDLWEVQEFYLEDGGNFWLALTDKQIVGTIALKNMGLGTSFLKRMFLHKNLRGSGLAQKMMRVLINHAKKQGITEIYLETGSGEKSRRAVAFFEKSGFQKVDSLPDNFVSDGADVFMKLIINN
jgi:N-acetylglutamate synthase-like GNAT family acetyltransferase